MKITGIRLLPPLAFARFGSASEPQENYTLKVDPNDPLGFRRIVPIAEGGKPEPHAAPGSEQLDAADLNRMFRDGDKIRPVAPFFEVFALTSDEPYKLVPLTVTLLKKNNLDISAIEWRVRVENRKVFRRTGDSNDIVSADTDWFPSPARPSRHARQELRGVCRNFIKDASIGLGSVQFAQPDASGAIRLRFMPAPGKIYGPDLRGMAERDFRPIVPYDDQGRPDVRILEELKTKPARIEAHLEPDKEAGVYREGLWIHFHDRLPGTKKVHGQLPGSEASDSPNNDAQTWPRETLPPSLFAIFPPAPPWLNGNRAFSRGYLDDACDGFIEVRIGGSDTLKAKARICVGPPDFVPDAVFLRTLADDLDQVANGPGAEDLSFEEARTRALDMVRRGAEAVRFMNVAVMNGNDVDGRAAAAFDVMPAEEAFGTERPLRPVMSPAMADTAAVLALHQQVYAALSAGAAPWFPRLLRRPNEMGDLTDAGRRKMPALMSGADSFYLAFTHRQIATLEKAARGPYEEDENKSSGKPAAPGLTPRNLTAQQLCYEVTGNPVNSRPEMAIANCCPGLEVDFRAIWRRLFEGIELGEHENYVVSGKAIAADGTIVDLRGRRLLRVAGKPVIATLTGPSLAKPDGSATVRSDSNPHGVWTMEWSNCLAHVVDARPDKETREVECEFTAEAAKDPQPIGVNSIKIRLKVRKFFEPGTAVISEALAGPGELTQGLCSPWQNDLRECSCFYWASSRPDFVNTEIGNDGLMHGDNWMAKSRTGEYYVPDDYVDTRLLGYEDLFNNWEQLQLQIGGKDSAPPQPEPGVASPRRKS